MLTSRSVRAARRIVAVVGVAFLFLLVFPLGVLAGARPTIADAPSGTGKGTTPSRIVTIGPNAAEIICALGARDAIVGVDKFCVFPESLASVPRVGGLFDPNLERIIALRPDLVVLRGHNESIESLCARLGVSVYHDKTERLDQIPDTIRELGALLGRGTQAEELIEAFRRRVDAIRARVADRPRPRVMLTVARQPDRFADLLTAGKGVFLTDMIEIAGGVNVFGDIDMGYPQVSVESILTRRPEVIIELMPEVDLTPQLRTRIQSDWRQLGPIPAVKSGRVHILTADHCLIPSPRYVDIIERVSLLLHPEPNVERRPSTSDADGH